MLDGLGLRVFFRTRLPASFNYHGGLLKKNRDFLEIPKGLLGIMLNLQESRAGIPDRLS